MLIIKWQPTTKGIAQGVLAVHHSGKTGMANVEVKGEFKPSETEEEKTFLKTAIESSFVEGYNYLKKGSLFADMPFGMSIIIPSNEVIAPKQNKTDMEEDIILREVPFKEAVKEIAELFKKKKRLFYSDIAEELRLDFGTVIKACRKLEKDRKIEEVKSEQKRAKKISK